MTEISPPALGTLVVDEAFRIQAACPETTTWAKRLGHEAILGQDLFVVFKSMLTGRARDDYLGVLKSGTAHVSVQTTQINGRREVTEIRKIPLHSREGKPQILTGVQNITEQAELDRMMRQTEKREILRVLSGGLAHNYNNLLGGISGDLNLARRHAAGPSSRVGGYIDRALSTFDRARHLTHELMTLADSGPPPGNAIALDSLCEAAIARVWEKSAPPGSPCSVDLPASLPRVSGDADGILRVLINLLRHARAVIPEDGIVRICGEHCEIDGTGSPARNPGRYVRVTVWDNGPPIKPEILHRAFDPFFSTRGSVPDLGLATAHAIVTQHGGTISIQSDKASGTEVTFFLRAASDG
jgi:signal transduction histidine kinase